MGFIPALFAIVVLALSVARWVAARTFRRLITGA